MASGKYLDQKGLETFVKSIKSKMNEELKSKVSSVKSGDENYITIDNTDPNNPIIALTQEFIDKVNKLWQIETEGKEKEETPMPVIDYMKEYLTNLIPSSEYSINGVLIPSNSNGEITIQPSWMGTNIAIVKKASDSTKTDSDVKELAIKLRPSAPAISVGGSNIYNVTTDMEYKLSTSEFWNNVTSNSILNLADGIYEVRLKNTDTNFSSEIALATIGSSTFIAVTDIVGIPSQIEQSTWDRIIEVQLNPVVLPSNATNQTIEWSIIEDGGTSMTLTPDNKIKAYNTGIMGLQAKIPNGLTPRAAYIKIVNIAVVAPHTPT